MEAPLKPDVVKTPVDSEPPSTQPKEASVSSAYPKFTMPPDLPRPPFIDVGGIANFRELGGYLCSPYGQSNSHIVRPSFLYRCALPNLVTPSGMDTVARDLSIKTVYDLRSAPEVNRSNAVATAANADSIAKATAAKALNQIRQFNPVYAAEDYSPDALARKLKWYSSPSSAAPPTSQVSTSSTQIDLPPYSLGFLNAYRDITSHGVTAYRTLFTHILNRPSDPLLFHCTAGKDRTGIFAALVLRLCGVDDDTICWEYALTEPGLGSSRDVFIARIAANGLGGDDQHQTNGGAKTNGTSNHTTNGNDHTNGTNTTTTATADQVETVSLEEAARICGSRSGNMRAYLVLVLDGELGGAEKYLTKHLGFTPDQLQQIKANLVIPVDQGTKVVKMTEIPGWTPEGGVEDSFVR